MTNGAGVFNVVVHARALVALNITTRSNAEWKIPPGTVFPACPNEAGRAWRSGLVEPLGDIATDADVGAFVAMRPGFEHEAVADLRAHGGRQFRTGRIDYAARIERAPRSLPAARTIVLGGPAEGDTPLPPPPSAFC